MKGSSRGRAKIFHIPPPQLPAELTRSGPKIPAAGHLEGVIFLDLWLNLAHFGSLGGENSL